MRTTHEGDYSVSHSKRPTDHSAPTCTFLVAIPVTWFADISFFQVAVSGLGGNFAKGFSDKLDSQHSSTKVEKNTTPNFLVPGLGRSSNPTDRCPTVVIALRCMALSGCESNEHDLQLLVFSFRSVPL